MPGRIHHSTCRGLKVAHEVAPGPITALAWTIRAGARFDRDLPGLAHLAEHMLFQGTDDRDQFDLNRRAADVGSQHNASTGYETITLTIEAFNEDVPDAIGLLAEQFYSRRIEEDRLRKEKRIVLDEIRSIDDDPLEYLTERTWSDFFGSPIGHPICGTRESVRQIGADDLRRYLDRHFQNGNAALAVVGGIDPKTLRGALRRHIRADVGRPPARSRRPKPSGRGILKLRGGPRGQAYATRFLQVDPDPVQLLAVGVALDLVGADPDSALFQAVREKHGLGYDVGAELEWGLGWGVAVLSASARPGQAGRVAEVMDQVLDESLERPFDPADIDRARRKRRMSFASLQERRLERAMAEADSVLTGFPSLAECQAIVERLDGHAVDRAWRRAAGGRSLTGLLPG